MFLKKGLLCGITLIVCLALLCAAAYAEENVYGKTLQTVRVRESASVSSKIMDNITSSACVYILETKKNEDYTFGKVHYRNIQGEVATGWVCLEEGDTAYVQILSDETAKSFFAVSGGNLPDARVGTFKVAGDVSSASSASVGNTIGGSSVTQLQTLLTQLGYYTGRISGNIGDLTREAIMNFQKDKGLQVTGKADSATLEAAKKAQSAGDKTTAAPSTTAKPTTGESTTAASAGVKELQERLKALGYYSAQITGNIGPKTEEAIKKFQKAKGLTVTGKADSATVKAAADAVTEAEKPSSAKGKVYNVDWFENKTSFYNKAGLKRGNHAKLTDLNTGRSLTISIQSTGNHADVEPVSAADTAALCAIYGVSSPSGITYVRRPMLVEVGEYRMVCSIYGVPHGEKTIDDNNFPGQFCLHFLNSKTNGSNRVDADHQSAISRAAEIMRNKGYTIVNKAPSI